MLFVLTGGIQTGKTRWLGRLVRDLAAKGVPCAGVLAPGVWRRCAPDDVLTEGERAAGAQEGSAYEKLGIDNVLLPNGERIPFARRADLAWEEGSYDEASQAARAGLGWAIDDASIARVNAHFDELRRAPDAPPSLLIVDELGRLELARGEGIVSAMDILDAGPSNAFPVALVVVRADLVPLARERLEPAWGAPVVISPDAERLVWAAL